jgi:hypothetical protein
MTEAPVEAVRRWRWPPSRLDPVPIEVVITVTANFSLARP